MKLSPETKHSLIIGGGLVLAVVLGIIVFKKYEANSQADQAASDQQTQDALDYLESMDLSGGYGALMGSSGGSSLSIPTAPASQSLAQEISSLESAFGFGSPSSSAGSSPTSGSSGSTAAAPSAPAPQPKAPLRQAPASDAVLGFGGGYNGDPVLARKFDLWNHLDEPVAPEGSYVA